MEMKLDVHEDIEKMRRKIFSYTVSLVLGITVWMYKSIFIFLCILFFMIFLYFLKDGISKEKRIIFFIILFFFTGIMRTACQEHQFNENQLKEQLETKSSGVIYKIEKKSNDEYKIYCCKLFINGTYLDEKIILSYYNNIENYPDLIGDTIEFYGVIKNPKESGNPRCFDYKAYLKSQKIYYICTVNSFKIQSNKKTLVNSVKSVIINKREKFLDSIKDEKAKGFVKGIIFGDKSELDENIYTDFRNNGTAHILAVSGLHVGVLFGIYKGLLKIRRSKFITVGFILMLLFYGTLTLWSISVTRAIILVTIVTVGDALNRRYDLATATAFVAIIILLSNPFMIINTGFQMSFLAILSIAFISPVLLNIFGKGISTMVAVQAGMIPYTSYVFNYIPLIGFFANIPIIFISSLLVPIGLMLFLFFLFMDNCPGIFLLEAIADLLININHIISNNGMLALDVVSPKLWIIVSLYLITFYLCSEKYFVDKHRKNKKDIYRMAALILTIVIASSAIGESEFDNAFAVFIDIGQGDALHLKANRGTDILIDGGGNIDYNVGENTLKPYLLKNNVWNIDLAAATHLHTDHYLGIEQLCNCFQVKKLLTKGKLGDKIIIDSKCFIEIIWPIEQKLKIDDENLNSLIYKINYNGITILITGDITSDGEAAMVEYYKDTNVLDCDVLKIAHHGSKYSTSDEFLNAADPRIAVISVGKNNYGHPSNEVIEKLDKKGIIVFRTDEDGAIGIIESKGKLKVCTKKQR